MTCQYWDRIDDAWQTASAAYDAGLLEGVCAMKVSTRRPNPRSSHVDRGVIIFYCGHVDDAPGTLAVGRRILLAMPAPVPLWGCIYWKADVQTRTGTAATGQVCNHMSKLKVDEMW